MIRDLMLLQNRMNRLFDDIFPRTQFGQEEISRSGWNLPVDIFEQENSYVLKADIPDVDPKDIDIRIEGNMLYLRGERKMEKEFNEENCYRMERSYGAFSRTFALPHNIETGQIQADYKSGVLTLQLPKSEQARPKQIKISGTQESRKLSQKETEQPELAGTRK